jgi:hypothetical protein
LELSDAKATLETLQSKISPLQHQKSVVSNDVPTEMMRSPGRTPSVMRMKAVEEEKEKLTKENKDLISQLEHKSVSIATLTKEKKEMKKQLEDLKRGSSLPETSSAPARTEDEILSKAKADAEKIIHNAKIEAESIKKKAMEEVDRMKRQSIQAQVEKRVHTELPKTPDSAPVENKKVKPDPIQIEKKVEQPKKSESPLDNPKTHELKKSFTMKLESPRDHPTIEQPKVETGSVTSISAKKEMFERIAKNAQPSVIDLKTLKEKSKLGDRPLERRVSSEKLLRQSSSERLESVNLK